MNTTSQSSTGAPLPSSDQQTAALDPRWLSLFPPTKQNGSSHSTSSFKDFQLLPPELMLQVLCHVPCAELLNLLQTCDWIREFFLVHQQQIFKEIQRVQYSEFDGWFGDLPSFVPKQQLATKENVKQVISPISKRPRSIPVKADNPSNERSLPDDVFAEYMNQKRPFPKPPRTCQQIQALKDAVFMLHWRTPSDADSADSGAAAALARYEKGRWYFLSLLGILQRQVDRDTGRLQQFLSSANAGPRVKMARQVVLCLNQMSWRASIVEDEPEDEKDMPARVEERVAIFRSQSEEVQKSLLSTLNLLTADISRHLGLGEEATSWMDMYRGNHLSTPSSMTTGEQLSNFASSIITGLLLHICFFYGIAQALTLNKRAKLGSAAEFLQQEIHYDVDLVLDTRLVTDWQGVPPILHPDIEEGLLWARGLGFKAGRLLV